MTAWESDAIIEPIPGTFPHEFI
jgi:hypothetical protein